jgi:hypothetical protein
MSAPLSPDNVFDWFPTFHTALFNVWAKRGVHTVWSDADLAAYEDWLVRYADATLQSLVEFFERRPPPVARDQILLATRNGIAAKIQHWKAEARRYRSEQKAEERRHRAAASPPELWRELKAAFRKLPDLSVDVIFGLHGGDQPSTEVFKILARRGGLALGYERDDAFRGWLVEVARYLREGRSTSIYANRVQPDDLIALGNDDYALRGADGSTVLDADPWIDHVADASVTFCVLLETEAFGEHSATPTSNGAEKIPNGSSENTCNGAGTLEDRLGQHQTPVSGIVEPRNLIRSFPDRAAWLRREMDTRILTPNGLYVQCQVDPKTTARILAGDPVHDTVIRKLASGLKVSVDQIPKS